jgi:predicted amidohydrolase
MTAEKAFPGFRAGLVQMTSGRDIAGNVLTASRLVREAVKGGARYVQTPEVTTIIESEREQLFKALEAEAAGSNRALAEFRSLARELAIWLHIGSMPVLVGPAKAANRSFLIDPKGELAATYDKIHMFDVELPGGESYRESRSFEPGRRAVAADLPWGRLGMTICYDLRFAQLYRTLAKAGATMLAIPAAFTVPTGAAHWHTLMRTRAIETGCFVLAAAQAGTHETGRKTYGHSLVVGPWGEVLAEGNGVDPTVLFADVDLAAVAEARRRVPALEHDRPFEVEIAGSGPATTGRGAKLEPTA